MIRVETKIQKFNISCKMDNKIIKIKKKQLSKEKNTQVKISKRLMEIQICEYF